ncbi:hypothetical protein SAMN05216420_101342 [Nitrosospira sp. Nl5]|uniref:hypothetical protein n=1 Tax=Nitrosospira sp. Nl5 TaxID=200120 RepID=UPI00088B20EF|nr:hypothetical protein [Nitrosospira sp. Nl5]SCX92206.1 hypothetical protein SAMN05216420_101342 [Nitrosospira sp. Nl5]
MDRLEWVERAAIENLEENAQISGLLRKESVTLLTLLLSGAGAALYFAAKETNLMAVAMAVSIWLFAIALLLSIKCLMFATFPAVWNEPKNLNNKLYDFEEVREKELLNMQERIERAGTFNAEKSEWLNNCIILACLTPGVALLTWAI